MGEAKLRLKLGHPFGFNKKQSRAASPFHRGLVLRPPYKVGNGRLEISNPDAHEIRLATLYWDRVACPKNNLFDFDNPDLKLLESEGVLVRPRFPITHVSSFDFGHLIESYFSVFVDLERSEPGRWAISQGNRDELLMCSAVAVDTGFLVDLVKALPVPLQDTPIDKILEYKMKRRAELLRLRGAIEGLHEKVLGAENRNESINKYAQEIELACLDLIKVSREEWKIFTLADLQTLFTGGTLAGTAEAVLHAQMPTIAGALGISGTALKIAKDVGLRRQQNRQNPYWYIAKFHSEVLR